MIVGWPLYSTKTTKAYLKFMDIAVLGEDKVMSISRLDVQFDKGCCPKSEMGKILPLPPTDFLVILD